MCGIIGYVGARELPGVLVDGLKRLEYRGYDSCGIGLLAEGMPTVIRAAGNVENLERALREHPREHPLEAGVPRLGIGHTRWATHGRPTEINAHPHCDCSGRFLVVHNGIIENHAALRRRLAAEGHRFRTETDTEVLPHLIEQHFKGSLEEAVLAALAEVEGMYALVALAADDRHKLVAARRGPPLVVGQGKGEHFVASDVAALLPYTRNMLFLGEGELAVVRRDAVDLRDSRGERKSACSQVISWSAEMAEKNGYPHFMLKEIHEQPRAMRQTIHGRLSERGELCLGEELPENLLTYTQRIHLLACGTSLHAAQVGKFMFESVAAIPATVDYASEFRYRDACLGCRDLVVAISQSGETADTLGAVEEARRQGADVLSISNVVGSSLARGSDGVFYTRAGPEIGVASTKAFTTQLAALYLLALLAASRRGSAPAEKIRWCVKQLREIPEQIERTLKMAPQIEAWAAELWEQPNFLFLGRGACYPIALEGALKLKEISYLQAEGYPAGEMKHGPIALIRDQYPVVVLAPDDLVYAKTLGNIEEVKGRGAKVLAIVTEGDTEASRLADFTACVPRTDPLLAPILTAIPLQLFAYYVAVRRGCSVDQPRNLAKTVTVE